MILPQPICDVSPAPMAPPQAPYEGAIIALVICVAIIIIAFIVKSIILNLHKSSVATSVSQEDEVAKIKLKLKGDLIDKLLAFEEALLAKESDKPEQTEEPKKPEKGGANKPEQTEEPKKPEKGGANKPEQTEEPKKPEQAEVYRNTMLELINNLDI